MKVTLMPLIAVVAMGVCVWSAEQKTPSATKVKRIGVEEFDKLRVQTNIVILDVRSPAEFAKGRIPGATNINLNSLQFEARVSALDKSKRYLVNCAVGMRSARACKKMESLGFQNLYDLAPGFDGWEKARKPVEK